MAFICLFLGIMGLLLFETALPVAAAKIRSNVHYGKKFWILNTHPQNWVAVATLLTIFHGQMRIKRFLSLEQDS